MNLLQIVEIAPDADQAMRLARIHQTAFDPVARWRADDFRVERERRVVLTDPDILHCLLMMQLAGDEAEILTLAVVPQARRQGWATALMQSGLAALRKRGAVRLVLEVADDNEGAISLYRELGFSETGRRRGYYRRLNKDRVDALILSLNVL